LPAHVAQQGIGEPKLFCPGDVGIIEIHTHTQNLGAFGLKLGEIKLEGQGFLGSRLGEGANVEKQDHWLFAQVVRQLDILPCRRGEFKHRRFLTHLEGDSLSNTANAYRDSHNKHHEHDPKSSVHL